MAERPTKEQIQVYKEGGRRRVLYVRLPDIYGLNDGFIVRTLFRGEIFNAYAAHGYPERKIPEDKPAKKLSFYDQIYDASVLYTPEIFLRNNSPCHVIDLLAQRILLESGAVEESKQQNDLLDRGARYANSTEGRADAIIKRFLGSTQRDLNAMNYEEWGCAVFQAINVAKGIDGFDLSEYLVPQEDFDIDNIMAAAEQEKLPPSQRPSPQYPAQRPQNQGPAQPPAQPARVARPGKPMPKSVDNRSALEKVLSQKPQVDPRVMNLGGSRGPDNRPVEVIQGKPRMFMAGEIPDIKKINREIMPEIRN